MKTVAIVAKYNEQVTNLKKLLKEKGLVYDSKNPDFIISLGGDGTFLVAERKFPGIPKMLIRHSKICNKCLNKNKENLLDLIKNNKFKITEHSKIEGKVKNKKFIAINDIVVRNKFANKALRFEISIDGKKLKEEIIGDGIVVSTVFGSTGYFKSITRKTFKKGIGLVFNNSMKYLKPLILKDKQKIKLTVTRGVAEVAYDNEPQILYLSEGETVEVKKNKGIAKTIEIKGLEWITIKNQ
mgnify:CR=1 FL=1|jgi:NAD kinase